MCVCVCVCTCRASIMQILEQEDELSPRFSFERNGSLSCVIPFSPLLIIDGLSRKSFSFNKLPQEPLKLNVLKLDGSSFGIEVSKMAKVAELKQAVEAAFSHLPKEGPGKVSWSHLWGYFCLCYDGEKLLTDSDYIGSYGIKDGDQLHFNRHVSINYNLIKTQSEKWFPDSQQHRISDACEEREQKCRDDCSCDDQEHMKHQQNDDDGDIITHSEYKLAHLLRGWFSHRRLTSMETSFEQKSCSNSSKFSTGFLGSIRNVARLYSNKYNSGFETWKAE